MPTIGLLSLVPPAEPRNWASPKAKTPPSEATSQYPFRLGGGAVRAIGWLILNPPTEPKNPVSPKMTTWPVDVTLRTPDSEGRDPGGTGPPGVVDAAGGSPMK